MSDRERWIVYPLLFFALTLAAQSACPLNQKNVEAPVDAEFKKLVCNELVVAAADRRRRVEIGNSENQSGLVTIYGPGGKPAVIVGVSDQGDVGVVETLHRSGKQMVVVGASDHGGVVQTADGKGDPTVILGATDRGGLVQVLSKEGPWRYYLGHGSGPLPSGLFAAGKDGLVLIKTRDKVIPWGLTLPKQRLEKPGSDTPHSRGSEKQPSNDAVPKKPTNRSRNDTPAA